MCITSGSNMSVSVWFIPFVFLLWSSWGQGQGVSRWLWSMLLSSQPIIGPGWWEEVNLAVQPLRLPAVSEYHSTIILMSRGHFHPSRILHSHLQSDTGSGTRERKALVYLCCSFCTLGFISRLWSLGLSLPMRQTETFNFHLGLKKPRFKNRKTPLPPARSFYVYPKALPPSFGHCLCWHVEKVTLGRWFWKFRKIITFTNDLVIAFIASQWSVKSWKRRYKTISFDVKVFRSDCLTLPSPTPCALVCFWMDGLADASGKTAEIRDYTGSSWSLLFFCNLFVCYVWVFCVPHECWVPEKARRWHQVPPWKWS